MLVIFFAKIVTLLWKKLYNIFYSKHYPSLASTFSYLSDIWIPRRKKSAFFEAIHKLTHFLISSYEENFFSERPCVIDRNK